MNVKISLYKELSKKYVITFEVSKKPPGGTVPTSPSPHCGQIWGGDVSITFLKYNTSANNPQSPQTLPPQTSNAPTPATYPPPQQQKYQP